MLTASIVTFNTPKQEVRDCLTILQASSVNKIYVIDNASDSRIRSIVDCFEKAQYLPSDNCGYGAGHNKAIRLAEKAGAEFHLVLNSDVEFSPNSITRLMEGIQADDEIALVHPRVTDEEGNDLYTSRLLPTPFDVFIRRFLPERLFSKRRERYILKHLDHNSAHDIPYHQGSFLLMRMSALKEVGLFDERFFMYPEDIDLCRRLHARYRTLYLPCPTVVHHHRAASYRSARMLGIHVINMIRYFNKWGWWCDAERKQMNDRLI